MSRPRKLVVGVLVAIVGLLAFEGLCSTTIFAVDVYRHSSRPFAERLHTEYHPRLGWVGTPGLRLADFYGPGRDLTTNARGFRGTAEVVPAVPAGRRRILCSGDSFTLGYGVGDGQTWTARLAEELEGCETWNLGQGGYGVDQSYLWYLEAAADLELDFHVLAFIPDDFGRMRRDAFAMYGKPFLEVEGGELETRNVPVPRDAYRAPWVAHNRSLLEKLGTWELLTRLTGRGRRKGAAAARFALDEARAAEVFALMVAALDARARERGGRLALLHLPAQEPRDPYALAPLPDWAARALEAAAAGGVPVIDLTDAFAALGGDERVRQFIPDGVVDFPGAKGHYSVEGNAFVARVLAERLRPLLPDPASRD